MNFLDDRLPARFWAKCIPEPMSGCWLWLGAITGGRDGGYGQMRWGGLVRYAHFIAFTTVHTLLDGLQIDHKCRNRACCNPAHLEAVTGAVNVQRGASGSLVTHCPKGHELTEANTIRDPRRRCKICHNASAARSMTKARA